MKTADTGLHLMLIILLALVMVVINDLREFSGFEKTSQNYKEII